MKNLLGLPTLSVLEAMQRIDETAEKVLIIVDEKSRLLGTLTDGDVRRCILKGTDLQRAIDGFFNPSPFYLQTGFSSGEAKTIMLSNNIQILPVIDKEKKVVDIIFWRDLFDKIESTANAISKYPVVIMAGGKGSRLDPITRIIPKPLIPLGGKTMVELVIDQFQKYGANEFFMTVNYKSELIRSYFDSIEYSYRMTMIEEPDFLGTAGSLQYLPEFSSEDFIVSNCDIMVDTDYSEVLRYHKENNCLVTMIASVQSYSIPYGVVQISESGSVKSIEEKPEYSFTVNTGVYILNKQALKYIPKDTFYNITDLIQSAIDQNEKVGVFPVGTKAYTDVGQWDEFHKNTEKFQSKK